ncbi:TPA: hypothetical protein DCY43_03190 [candidate division WWE3 bacterium]|uniref:Acyl carrier protein n=5 Tax=Katanobacteria TaxID=422282 RepID=A0A0G1KMP4_UNCKA|nr:MAG: Acyl carrier protein [candidate division WWE3 bacterium GW2011_GWA2_44_16]KKT84961.1 MAG: Acyl carrier protein [candidate division WWE3 bacterium GW2011_GWC2_44_9]OGC51432.1 MAG: hypothetical protein A2709_03135 [candidate division WWE3 bacterium RIFCSPHIGHO2_01_FULL_43_9]HAZ29722.1 hypothetical protein [candidate division WWE3 bacterium]
MKNSNFKDKVKQIISKKAGVEPCDVDEELFFGDDLNLGDIELTEILEELEELFKVELLEDQSKIESVRDLMELLEEKLE